MYNLSPVERAGLDRIEKMTRWLRLYGKDRCDETRPEFLAALDELGTMLHNLDYVD